ncbi:MAG: type I methionyl aminopeptidase [Candidatus Yonathbacteria bacterium]|nr:type I methionyl aminopeptidase [Candidatus Yonathbacteria bacterium]
MIKTPEDIAILREGGKILATILKEVGDAIVPGVTTKYLDTLAETLIREQGAIPSFLNYTPEGAKTAYPGTLCVSVNDEVVHGIPGERVLEDGDIVDIDLGLEYQGLFVDMAMAVPIGEVDASAKKLLMATREALEAGIRVARAGNTLGDIGYAIEGKVRGYGFTVVEELGGHGVGYAPHEEPHIANYGEQGKGMKLKAGMVLAIEPIVNEGTRFVKLLPDGYTFVTRDHKRSAQFEHTILITDGDAEILTKGS